MELQAWLVGSKQKEVNAHEEYASLDADNKELLRMLAAILKTSKTELKDKN